jgi:CRP/FNR family transcriptional regulator, nitrogen fixation regulation protein
VLPPVTGRELAVANLEARLSSPTKLDDRHLDFEVKVPRSNVGVLRSYASKSEIIREDDPADRVYEVVSGAVCTYRMMKEGRRQISGFYFSGDIFGLEAAEKHVLAAEAITNAKVRIAKKQALNALASRDAKVADWLLLLTALELARKQDLALILSRSAEDRVIYFLIEMSQRISPNEYLIALPMARQDVADYLGLTLETVSRNLRDLERRGAIKIHGRRYIVLRNQYTNERPEKLADLFEGVTGRPPKSEQELSDWLVSSDGTAATVFKITSFSRWGDRART